MGDFLKNHPVAAAISVLGAVFTVASGLLDAYDIVSADLPNLAWLAIGLGVFAFSLIAIVHRLHQDNKRRDRTIEQQQQAIKQQHEAIKQLTDSASVRPAAGFTFPTLPAEQQLPKAPPKLLKEHKASLLAERETLVVRRSTYLDRRSELQSDLPKQYMSSERQAITQRIEDISRDLTSISERISEIDEMLTGG